MLCSSCSTKHLTPLKGIKMSCAEGGGVEGPGLKLSGLMAIIVHRPCTASRCGTCSLCWWLWASIRIPEGFPLLVLGAGVVCHGGLGHWKSVFCNLCFHHRWILWVRGHCTEKNRKEIKWIPGLQKSIASYQSALWCVIHAYKCSVFLSLFKYGRDTTTFNLTNACQKFYVQCVCVCSANDHSCCVSSL